MMHAPSCPRSLLRNLLPRLTAASGIGYVATAYTVSRWLTRRSPAPSAGPPHLPGLAVEALECRTADGIRLRGWAVSPPAPRATVALFHGLRENRGQMVGRVGFLTRAGYRCVAFDQRAHGQSGGRRTSFGYHEGQDVRAVLDLVRRRWPADPRAALGVSMGAAALCFAGPATRALDAVVLESLYHNLASAFQHRVGVLYPDWFRHFRRGIIWVTERRLGVRIHQVAPLAHVHELAPRPVLLLTGSEDPHATPDEVRLLYDRCGDPRQFHVIPGAGHSDVCERGGQAYEDLVLAFLRQHLGA